jgi:hypothetical protein
MKSSQPLAALLRKYDVPTPRYTSYPTVPCWDVTSFSDEKWKNAVHKTFKESNDEKGISLYLHLPFAPTVPVQLGSHIITKLRSHTFRLSSKNGIITNRSLTESRRSAKSI